MNSIYKKYRESVIPRMKEEFKFKNSLECPKIKKVIVNVGIGKFLKDNGQVSDIEKSIETITGQKPLMTQAKKSIAGFKIREGLNVGIKVTLRGRRMWDFIERFVNAALPRVRDFHGIKKSAVDKGGNLNIGIKEHLIFPEIFPEQVKNIFSLEVNVVTDAKNREIGESFFRKMGFPMEVKE